MKAFQVVKPKEYGMVDVDVPKAGPGEVLVKIGACGICGSDLDVIEGTRPMSVTSYPCILGHEMAGEVVEIGAGVRGLEAGDKVAIDAMVTSPTCPNCRRGWVCHSVDGYEQLGFTRPGGMAEYVAAPQSCLYKIPSDLDPAKAALNEPASCAGFAISKASIQPGDNVVVVGSAAIAVFVLQIAKLFSPKNLIVIGGRDQKKLELARKLGATHTLNASKDNVVEAIMDITGGHGGDAIIECSGNARAMEQTFDYAGTKSRTVCIGVPPDLTLKVDFLKMLTNDTSFAASNGYTTDIYLWVLDLLTSGFFDTDSVITHRIPISEAERGFQILWEKKELAVKVMLVPE